MSSGRSGINDVLSVHWIANLMEYVNESVLAMGL